MKTFISICLLLSSAVWLTGCPSSLTGETYSRSEVRKAQQIHYGTIEETRLVQIEGTKTVVGPAAGAAVGGLAGSTVGSGTGSKIAAVVGGLAGGLAGGAAEEAVTRTQGIELVVRLDNGRMLAVVQEVSPNVQFRVGDRVRLLTVNGVMRVSH